MRNFVLLVGAGAMLIACNTQELENQVAQLELEKSEIKAAAHQKDASLTEFMQSMSDIEGNLREIREREMNIALAREANLGAEALGKKIKEDVKVINELLVQNRSKIDYLNQQVAVSQNKNSKLNRMMGQLQTELTQQIDERETQIDTLKGQLLAQQVTIEALNTNLTTLMDVNHQQDSLIDRQTVSLNTAYYAMGSTKELEEKQVIDREGGLLGLGRTKKLRSDLENQHFDQIDIREQRVFPVQGDKLELVTAHPSHTYTIEQDEASDTFKLVIADPESFWASSKYLVMVTE